MKEIDKKIAQTDDVPEVTRFTTSETRSQATRHWCTEHSAMCTVQCTELCVLYSCAAVQLWVLYSYVYCLNRP